MEAHAGQPLPPPTLAEVRAARNRIAAHIGLPTPLVHSPALSALLQADVWLKYEFANPIGAFKLRGGLNLAASLAPEERAAGLVTASTGNHGQSIAYAARAVSTPATIFVPRGANPDKVASMERLGARVVAEGEVFDEARLAAQRYAEDTRARHVHVADEPALIAGVATAALEVLEDQHPQADLVLVPVGGGSGACGWVSVRDALGHHAEVWGVQSAQAPAAHDAWASGELVERPNRSRAEGVATGVAFATTQAILRDGLADFLLVDDDRTDDAVLMLLEQQHVLVEPAGALALAAALQQRHRVRGRQLVLVLSGSNITRAQLQSILARADSERTD